MELMVRGEMGSVGKMGKTGIRVRVGHAEFQNGSKGQRLELGTEM